MTANKLTIKLTAEQQKQINDVTGQAVSELHFNVTSPEHLSEGELDQVTGGVSEFTITMHTDSSSPNLS